MQTAKIKPPFPDINMDLPIDIAVLPVSDDDCFGREWDVKSPICLKCAGNDICFLKYQEVIDKKVKAIEDTQKTIFLDKTDFKAVEDIEAKLVSFLSINDGKYNIYDLLTTVMSAVSTSDEVAASEWIKKFIVRNGFIVRNEVVYIKNNQ